MLFGFKQNVKILRVDDLMKKRILCFFLLLGVMICFIGCTAQPKDEGIIPTMGTTLTQAKISPSQTEEMRAVWINYNELSMSQSGGGDEGQFREKISRMFDRVVSLGLNTVFVHARAFSDAFYQSEIFPASKYMTGTQGVDPGYDPLAIAVEEAHKRDLQIHAWINPYRVSLDQDFDNLCDTNPAKKWYLEGGATDPRLIVCEQGIYYNPASPEAQKLIIDGVREIITGYDIDGIHYDDYFYPSTEASIDKTSYQAYLDTGGKYSLEEWRCENVNNFVSGVYSVVKGIVPEIRVSISPSANIEYNEEKMYADVRLWAQTPGYCDDLIPQVYYGFENETLPFEATVKQWNELCTSDTVRLCFGLAFYKCGGIDEFASSSDDPDSARYEWQRRDDIIVRQLELVRSLPQYRGYALYSYTSLSSPSNDNAREELKKYCDQVTDLT